MKKKLIAILAAVVMAFAVTACGGTELQTVTVKKEKDVTYKYSDAAVRYAARADKMARTLVKDYLDTGAYEEPRDSEDWELFLAGYLNPFNQEQDDEASVWHYTSVIAMTNRLAAVYKDDADTKKYYLDFNSSLIEELAWYRGTGSVTNYNGTHPETMYGVKRGKKREKAAIEGKEAVYDDQMWIIREMIAAYGNTANPEYLKEAERLTAVCLDGWNVSKKANGEEWGGITWGPYYSSFHTCSNAPIIKPLCDLAALYKGKTDKIGDAADAPSKYDYYLEWAKKVYDFTYNNLKNADNTYADAFWTDRNTVEDTENIDNPVNGTHYETVRKNNTDPKAYTYNVGAMISGGAELYKLTNEKRYLDEALTSAEAANHAFAIPTDKGVYNLPSTSTVWFNLVLLQGYMDLAPVAEIADEYIAVYRDAFDYAYDHYYYKGYLPRNYVEGWVVGDNAYDTRMDIMDAAANAEMYAMLSQYYAAKKA